MGIPAPPYGSFIRKMFSLDRMISSSVSLWLNLGAQRRRVKVLPRSCTYEKTRMNPSDSRMKRSLRVRY
jgi:hypothetical protein